MTNRGKMEKWGELIGKKGYKIIKQEILPNKKFISTVWLGVDYQFERGKPLIFETMVFPEKGNWRDEDVRRYTTLKEARAGHKLMVKTYEKKM